MAEYLVAFDASRLERFGVMSAAVHFAIFEEVDQIDQQLHADDAHKTRRMPDDVTSGPTCKHRQVARSHRLAALQCSIAHRSTTSIFVNTQQQVAVVYIGWPKKVSHCQKIVLYRIKAKYYNIIRWY